MSEILGPEVRVFDRARMSRDARFDGKFFIAVTSTGIYCRSICPARTSKRSNIHYYPTAAAAAAAGFRPCLRCRPEAAPGTPAWLGTSAVVRRALRLIDDGALDRDSVEQMAARLGIGARHLHRLFVQHVGAPPIEVAQTRRLHFAKRLLDETDLSITEIALAAGFGSLRRFNSSFHATYGRPPRELRRQRRPGSAENDVVLKLAFRPPYDWEQVRDFLAARAVPGVEQVDDLGYARIVPAGGAGVVICVRPLAEEPALELRVRGADPGALFQIVATARRVFDLAADPSCIAASLGADDRLAPLLERRPGLRIPGVWEPFECAVRAIVGQQVSVAAARTLLARLVRLCGRRISDAGLTHLFPTASQVARADLSGIGLTRARRESLRALARAVAEGRVTFDGSSDDVTAALQRLPGVGDWTAQYVALRALNEPDAFPAADLVLRRVTGNGRPLSTKVLQQQAEDWRPWRGYAAMHLWRGASDAAKRG